MNADILKSFWTKFPWEAFPLSLKVDFALYIIGEKPLIRTYISDVSHFTISKDNLLRQALKAIDTIFIQDQDGYILFGKDHKDLNVALEIDRSSLPHTKELGVLLGYPLCCCVALSEAGESNIDSFEKQLFEGQTDTYDIIVNTQHYNDGISLISHVPCKLDCELSLKKAKRVALFLKDYAQVEGFGKWALETVNKMDASNKMRL